MIDLNSTKTQRHAASEAITRKLDAVAPIEMRVRELDALAKLHDAFPPQADDYWGRSISASAVGDECARRVQLGVWPNFHPDKRQPRKAPLTEKDARVFARGHHTEALMGEWMKEAGFPLLTETSAKKQFGFVTAGGQIKGYADGVLTGEPLKLWEHKTLGNKGWRKVWNNGIAKAYPNYDAQAQLLMAYLAADASLFTVWNAETGELYAEEVAVDATKAQAVSDRAVHILKATRAGDLLPKAGANAQTFPCAWCRFKDECWPGG